MFKGLGQRSQNKKQKTKNLWNREFDIVEKGLDEKQVSNFIEELIVRGNDSNGAHADVIRALMERAILDAQNIVTKIKAEAENEAVKIIDAAKLRADEIKKKEAISVEKEAEEIISLISKNNKSSDAEARQRLQQLLLQIKSEIESEVRKEYREAHSRLLFSLLGSSDGAVKEINMPAVSGFETKQETVQIDKTRDEVYISEKVKEEGKNEEIKNVKAEEKKAKEEVKKAEKETKLAEKEQAKREAEERKKAAKESKRKNEGMTLFARIGAFKDNLNDKLSQPIGGKQKSPVPVPVQAHKDEPVEPVKENAEKHGDAEVRVSDEKPDLASVDKSKEIMDLIYPETAMEPTQQVENKVEAEDIKEIEGKAIVQPVKTEEENLEPAEELVKGNEGILYTGNVEISVEVPVNLVAVSKLYNYLQTTPDVKVMYTKGSWDKATIIMVSVDKPLPLIDMISRIPGITVTAKTSRKEAEIKGVSSSLIGTRKDEIKKVSLILKEA